MRTLFNLGLVTIVVISLISCDQDETNTPTPQPNESMVLVSLSRDTSILENSTQINVFVELSRQVASEVSLSISVTPESATFFQTNPNLDEGQIDLIIPAGQIRFPVSLKTIDNSVINGDRMVTFTITDASQGVVIGTKKTTHVTILDDESPQENIDYVTANFAHSSGAMMEGAVGYLVEIQFSQPVSTAGNIHLSFEQKVRSQIISTSPALQNGQLTLTAELGATSLSFIVMMTDDQLVLKHDSLSISIGAVTGGLVIGNQDHFLLDLYDDELTGKPKTVTTSGGGWYSSQTYEYDELGRLSKMFWESRTPFTRQGNYAYSWADNGLISRVNHYPEIYEVFLQQDGRIYRSEEYNHGELRSYKLYDYDIAGNVGAVQEYHKQPGGEFTESLTWIYLYHDDNNLYAQLGYTKNQITEEYELLSERYYSSYHPNYSNFFGIEVIPGIKAQTNFPGIHTYKTNGHEFVYHFSYTLDSEGRVSERRIPYAQGSDYSTYSYY
ncbi:hypothetical protein [Marinoscillum sp.]|uniref:hypothetical protein n=1 Tax=Marinoscillum sp. TaxID=2024838 RepID=UPI003BAA9033